MKRPTRLLALLGLLALLAMERSPTPLLGGTDKPPVNPAVTASNDLAFDLYGRLAQEDRGKNLFFSPYSIFNALLLVAEGARRETADEMGRALRLPRTVRRAGDDARAQPWGLEPIHRGMAELNRRFEEASRPPSKTVLGRLASLRKRGKTKGDPQFDPTFQADRPFMFLLRDRHSGAILFLGRLSNPTLTPPVRP